MTRVCSNALLSSTPLGRAIRYGARMLSGSTCDWCTDRFPVHIYLFKTLKKMKLKENGEISQMSRYVTNFQMHLLPLT